LKLAFVVQRYGLEVNGGAELLCRQIAEHLSKFFKIEIITTCAIDYVTWKNEYPEGISQVNNVTVHRFPVDYCRDDRKFSVISEKVFNHPHSSMDEAQWMKAQGPYSTRLLQFLKEQKNNFDFFIFFTYLYCTTYFGLPLVKEKAILIPAAHDEPPIYLSIFHDLFSSPLAVVYSTPEERKFVTSRFSNGHLLSSIIGTAAELPASVSPVAKKKNERIENFIIYIGRIDESKGCRELFENFMRFKSDTKSGLKLVLLGKPVMQIPKHADIIHLGFVSEKEKFNALAAAKLLVMPSAYESFSIVLLEAWLCGIPVLVNGTCEVLKGQCIRSNAGLWYTSYTEFSECLDLLLADQTLNHQMGIQGRKFVNANYTWDIIEKKYLGLFEQLSDSMKTDI